MPTGLLDGEAVLSVGRSIIDATADSSGFGSSVPQSMLYGFGSSHVGSKRHRQTRRAWVSEIVGWAWV